MRARRRRRTHGARPVRAAAGGGGGGEEEGGGEGGRGEGGGSLEVDALNPQLAHPALFCSPRRNLAATEDELGYFPSRSDLCSDHFCAAVDELRRIGRRTPIQFRQYSRLRTGDSPIAVLSSCVTALNIVRELPSQECSD